MELGTFPKYKDIWTEDRFQQNYQFFPHIYFGRDIKLWILYIFEGENS